MVLSIPFHIALLLQSRTSCHSLVLYTIHILKLSIAFSILLVPTPPQNPQMPPSIHTHFPLSYPKVIVFTHQYHNKHHNEEEMLTEK